MLCLYSPLIGNSNNDVVVTVKTGDRYNFTLNVHIVVKSLEVRESASTSISAAKS
jgi:hypothetical protein